MDKEDTSNVDVKDTMEIIINAGDARDYIAKALDNVAEFDYQTAHKNLNAANDKLIIAHRLQTKKLQEEAEGDNVKYSVLFTHAQDTLMSIMSEFNIAKKMVTIFEKRDKDESK